MEAVRSPVPHHQVNVYTHTHLHVVPGARTLRPPRVQRQPGPLCRGWVSSAAQMTVGRVRGRNSFLLSPHGEAGAAALPSFESHAPPAIRTATTPPAPGIGLEEGGPAPQLPAACCGVGWAASSVTSGLGSATGAAVGKYSAATHRLRGPRRPTWCGRWAGSRPQPAGTLGDLSGCRPPGGAPGCVQSPGGVPPQQAQPPPLPPHLRPMLGRADKELQGQEPAGLVDKSGHCPPLPPASPADSERCRRDRCTPGHSVRLQDPSLPAWDPRVPASSLLGTGPTPPTVRGT